MTLVTLAAAGLFALLSIPSAVQAGELAAPIGKVVLEVSGAITHTNRDGIAAYDVDMLEALESRTTVTTTPWYDGPRRFSGPLGQAVIDSIGATGTTLRVTAINDYVTDIPLADLMEYPVILATRLDGERMSVREKGPIFVIYPFDEAPELNNETYYGRSAWQVKSIEVY